MSMANGATPYQPEGERNQQAGYSYPHAPRQAQQPYPPQQAPYPYSPMARPAVPRQSIAANGYPYLLTRPARVQQLATNTAAAPRTPKSMAAPRMPKAQALDKVRALKKVILGVTLSSFVAFSTLAATHTHSTSSTASASSSASSSGSSSAQSGSTGNSNSASSSSGYGFGSSTSSSQAPVSGSSTS